MLSTGERAIQASVRPGYADTASLRANTNDYNLVLFDRLSPSHKHALNDLQGNPEFFGVLIPRGSHGLGIKSVTRDVALLYYTLQEPGLLPGYVRTLFGETCERIVAELILDSVLEIEWNGTFVSGAAAYRLLYGKEVSYSADSKLSRLSTDALKYAQELEMTEVSRLSARMYFYNRQPISPYWKRVFPSDVAVAEYLGIEPGGANKPLLDRTWSRVPLVPPRDGWFMWSINQTASQPSEEEPARIYKLYISPIVDHVRDVFTLSLETLSRLKVITFKVGNDVFGLLRPDKIIAYFATYEDLMEAAGHLQTELKGYTAHGVPFSAEIGLDGLLSWGMDPPRREQGLGWQERESWRLWVTNRLAAALVSAKANESRTLEPWQFAIERLRLEGVDTNSWIPATNLWEELER
ncbi:MAG TPA: hypothetical protein VJ183_03680 [Chloroflexia bacterium]|nr:hypothetical protein [Chloroflexia bacterium]